jgi:hypothetical protein
MTVQMRKVVTFSSPLMPKELLDKLTFAVVQDGGKEKMIEWSLNDDGTLDLSMEVYE